MSGYFGRIFAKAGSRISVAAYSVAVRRTVPPGLSRSSLSAARSASISLNFGPMLRNSRSPAWVGAARRPVQKSDADPLLQVSDDLAQCGLRHAQLRRGTRETALPRHREKSREVARVLSMHG